ncbi:MAG: hypothetical protein AVDCRST_MAG68-5693 [uncultured Gemmatimonadetes bacterium]|uniref:Exonuclease domain-containing protein n=1 Tax=uncultured Gemmatimonadota bacterium TaxID=203437 RepID=A0A6J4MYW9_9BACT|nr:MAG: hypothetical protein AVDCRST_MAG68-5693 [uncultured Gemmatimonadota bacterium]
MAGVTLPGPDNALDRIADVLRSTGQYRVLARFRPREQYAEDGGQPKVRALFADVETTGLDVEQDRIIQLALVPFEYAAEDGAIVRVHEPWVGFEDPGRPVPAEITALTGIRDADVAGRCLDDAAVAAHAASAGLVVAHNAAFDRPFLERRFAAFADRPWACSMAEVPWAASGFSSAKLEFLLWKSCGEFFDGHRADEDCRAGVHLLATPLPSGELPMSALLRSCRRRTARVWAADAPFRHKDALRARGYRWSGGERGRLRGWYLDADEAAAAAECRWLEERIYGGRPGWDRQTYGARVRYSDRVWAVPLDPR